MASEDILEGVSDSAVNMSSHSIAVAHGSNCILKLINISACFAFHCQFIWFGCCFSEVKNTEGSERITEVLKNLSLSKKRTNS